MQGKVLITGVAGFLGSNLAKYLKKTYPNLVVEGWDNLSTGYLDNVPENVPVRKIALGLEDIELEPLLKDVDYVFHFAAYPGDQFSNFIRCYETAANQIGSYQLMNACINVQSVKRLIFASSLSVYGFSTTEPPFKEDDKVLPTTPYDIGKIAVEDNLLLSMIHFGLDYTILRIGSVYGPNQNGISPFRNTIARWMFGALRNASKTITNPEQLRAFVYVGDVVPAIWKAAIEPSAGRTIINLDGDVVYTHRQVAALCNHICGGKYEVTQGPSNVEKLWGDSTRAKEILGYKAETSIEEGLQSMWDWVKEKVKDNPERLKPQRVVVPEVDRELPSSWLEAI